MTLTEHKVAVTRLIFIAVYSVAFVAAGFGHWSQPVFLVEYLLVSVLWLLLLGLYAWDLRRSGGGWLWARSHLAIPLLLVAPLFLFLNWDVLWFALVIVAYILELREHSAGNGFMFSFGLIAFVGLVSALTMVELENDVSNSSFASPADALYWAFGGLLRINTGRSYSPTTEDGRFLTVVIAICGVLAASMFTAKLVTWVVGDTGKQGRRTASEQDEAETAATTAALRTQLAEMRADVDRLMKAADHKEG